MRSFVLECPKSLTTKCHIVDIKLVITLAIMHPHLEKSGEVLSFLLRISCSKYCLHEWGQCDTQQE